MTFKSIAEFLAPKNGHNPTSAERKLIAATQAGKPCILIDRANPTRPTGPDDDVTIRASLLRLLILGGTKDCGLHERGVHLEGGWIEGSLDLECCRAHGLTQLRYCHFTDRIEARLAKLQLLDLEGSLLPGLHAPGVEVARDIVLKNADATDTIALFGASLDGKLDLDQASFSGANTDGKGPKAILAQRMKVAQGFYFRKVRKVHGIVDMTAAHVGDLIDEDMSGWPRESSNLVLDGFTYDRLSKRARFTLKDRRAWLEAGSVYGGHFRPQPYTQLARVLRQMGHAGEAREVLIERTFVQGAANRAARLVAPNGDVSVAFRSLYSDARYYTHLFIDRLALVIAGYGYAPVRASYWALACIGVSSFAYMGFWCRGVMVPTDAVILTSWEWLMAYISSSDTPALIWAESSGPATSHYETFYSLPYALDVFLPIVDLGQQSTWGQTTVTTMGKVARVYTWGLQIAGYVITSLGLAAATGIIQRNQPD